ncbi:MAG: HdaA/DnaA family protein [Caulobacteraceae bacterium]
MTTSSSARSARQLRLDLGRTPSYARDDFIVSACNAAAVAAIEAWPKWPGGRLALIGPAGSGKTHLARAWAAMAGATTPALSAGLDSFRGPMLIEDADRRAPDELLFHLFNLADGGASLLITGRTAPATWPARLPDLRSRLKALTVVGMEPPDDFVLLGVMKKLFSERNIKPGTGVADYIIRRVERSAPALQDLVRRIDERAGAERREVTLPLVRDILHQRDEILDRGG